MKCLPWGKSALWPYAWFALGSCGSFLTSLPFPSFSFPSFFPFHGNLAWWTLEYFLMHVIILYILCKPNIISPSARLFSMRLPHLQITTCNNPKSWNTAPSTQQLFWASVPDAQSVEKITWHQLLDDLFWSFGSWFSHIFIGKKKLGALWDDD